MMRPEIDLDQDLILLLGQSARRPIDLSGRPARRDREHEQQIRLMKRPARDGRRRPLHLAAGGAD